MDLSVIIVSYNVRYLLESCIDSLISALKEVISAEIIIVDNASTDGTSGMIKTKYQQVKLIENETNLGFSKANNLGVSHAKGEFILILNPDTLVNKNAITTSLNFLKSSEDIGIAGVRMVDGSGLYLQESKRGFPDVWSSFFKITGVNKIFPNHKFFNHYYLGEQQDDQINEVEVLTGAYMMMRKSTFNSVGGFDEDYFMYGEDIDLSTRIRKAGKKLIYLGNEQIIHLKGRSSKNDSYTHVKNFYQAMSIFVNKNYNNVFSKWILHIGIAIAGLLSFIKRKMISNFILLADAVLIAMVIYVVKTIWGKYWFGSSTYFDNSIFIWNAVGYLVIWILSIWFFGSDHSSIRNRSLTSLKSIWIGTVLILIIYSLLPEHMRSSRMVILFSALILSFLFPLYRRIFMEDEYGHRALFINLENNEEKYNSLFRSLSYTNQFAYLSNISDSSKLRLEIERQSISKVIFNPSILNTDATVKLYKLIPTGVDVFHVVSVTSQNNFQIQEGNMNLSHIQNQILKWILNTFVSVIILPFGWMNKSVRKDYIQLLFGLKYWVGYDDPIHEGLPYKKAGHWHHTDDLNKHKSTDELNLEYAMKYSLGMDLRIILDHMIK